VMSKMPGIGDIPILGELFKSHSINRTNTDLLVLVTPVIVDPASGEASTTPVPARPVEPVKNLDSEHFDKKLGADKGTTKLTGM